MRRMILPTVASVFVVVLAACAMAQAVSPYYAATLRANHPVPSLTGTAFMSNPSQHINKLVELRGTMVDWKEQNSNLYIKVVLSNYKSIFVKCLYSDQSIRHGEKVRVLLWRYPNGTVVCACMNSESSFTAQAVDPQYASVRKAHPPLTNVTATAFTSNPAKYNNKVVELQGTLTGASHVDGIDSILLELSNKTPIAVPLSGPGKRISTGEKVRVLLRVYADGKAKCLAMMSESPVGTTRRTVTVRESLPAMVMTPAIRGPAIQSDDIGGGASLYETLNWIESKINDNLSYSEKLTGPLAWSARGRSGSEQLEISTWQTVKGYEQVQLKADLQEGRQIIQLAYVDIDHIASTVEPSGECSISIPSSNKKGIKLELRLYRNGSPTTSDAAIYSYPEMANLAVPDKVLAYRIVKAITHAARLVQTKKEPF